MALALCNKMGYCLPNPPSAEDLKKMPAWASKTPTGLKSGDFDENIFKDTILVAPQFITKNCFCCDGAALKGFAVANYGAEAPLAIGPIKLEKQCNCCVIGDYVDYECTGGNLQVHSPPPQDDVEKKKKGPKLPISFLLEGEYSGKPIKAPREIEMREPNLGCCGICCADEGVGCKNECHQWCNQEQVSVIREIIYDVKENKQLYTRRDFYPGCKSYCKCDCCNIECCEGCCPSLKLCTAACCSPECRVQCNDCASCKWCKANCTCESCKARCADCTSCDWCKAKCDWCKTNCTCEACKARCDCSNCGLECCCAALECETCCAAMGCASCFVCCKTCFECDKDKCWQTRITEEKVFLKDYLYGPYVAGQEPPKQGLEGAVLYSEFKASAYEESYCFPVWVPRGLLPQFVATVSTKKEGGEKGEPGSNPNFTARQARGVLMYATHFSKVLGAFADPPKWSRAD